MLFKVLEPVKISCPYCGEQFQTSIDLSTGSHRYVEDCQVCCRPIEFDLFIDLTSNEYSLSLKRDDE